MDVLDNRRRLLLVHAHPDDETIGTGITMARYAAEGVHVTLVTCTLGEEGEILVPALEHLGPDGEDTLGEHRREELAAAMEALGVHDYRFLGGPGRYRDSGMMGEPSNERPHCFWRADLDEAAGDLVATLREVRPQVVVTYDENGGYGHPDHIQAHRVTMRAVERAADRSFRPELGEPWDVLKLYWSAVPRSVLQAGIDALKAAGETDFFGVEKAEDLPFAIDDALVTTAVEGAAYTEAKNAAMRAHATQIAVDGPFFALSNNVGLTILSTEYFRLVAGEQGPLDGATGRESDLFGGLGQGRR
ncbi:MAG: N-acetyl-1-D-myo-inositol-2-amino-2-deoxy-alpha-D-glucopyranoside deacetylase [Actinomycetes bacterium]